MANKDILTAEALQDQLADLKAEFLQLSEALSSTGKSAADRAGPALEATADAARHIVHSVRDQGQAAVDAIKENPGMTASVTVTAGLLGLAVGYLIGTSSSQNNSRWRF